MGANFAKSPLPALQAERNTPKFSLASWSVENFRQIRNSGTFQLCGFNVLRGDSQAGKTTILEALRCFSLGSDFPSYCVTDGQPDSEPKITCHLEMSSDQAKHLADLSQIELDNSAPGPFSISIAKTFPGKYSLVALSGFELSAGLTGDFYDLTSNTHPAMLEHALKFIPEIKLLTADYSNDFLDRMEELLVSQTPADQTINIDKTQPGERMLLSLFALTTAVSMLGNQTIILLDEPEIELSPNQQERLVAHLGQISNSNKVVVATHSEHMQPTGTDDKVDWQVLAVAYDEVEGTLITAQA